ncbi:hypothetical protein CJ739_2302 [Mariniflexile rhizosphaerae]|nr:hypothetical protein CJ739_2302 [Mariniflexile sp. TRM1-10]
MKVTSKKHERSELAQAKSEANKRQLITSNSYTPLFGGNIYSQSAFYRSFSPFPSNILGIDFSILDSRVFDCLACEKYSK